MYLPFYKARAPAGSSSGCTLGIPDAIALLPRGILRTRAYSSGNLSAPQLGRWALFSAVNILRKHRWPMGWSAQHKTVPSQGSHKAPGQGRAWTVGIILDSALSISGALGKATTCLSFSFLVCKVGLKTPLPLNSEN